MSEARKSAESPGPGTRKEKLPYETPAIAWEEDYHPTVFGVSCAREPGNPSCAVGPSST
jgi:hypothetical protein